MSTFAATLNKPSSTIQNGLDPQWQDSRHIADYDNGKFWSLVEATEDVVGALSAFETWNQIKHQNIAQEYLVSVLIRPRA